MGPDFVRDGTELALAESLLCGVTTVNDMYFFADVTAAACRAAGMRATVGLLILDFPTAWAKSSDENIKYYSGTANYKTTFIMNKLPANKDVFINLGEVSVMAEVKLNGQNIGGVWIAPNRLNVSDAIVQGENELEIEVVNLWRNRLIKDKLLPENKRYTWTVVEDIHEGEEPHKSGLLGPVTIEIIK